MLYRIYILFVSIILSNEYDQNLLMKIYDKFSLDTTLVPKYNIIKEEEKLVYVGDDIYGRKSMMEEEASVYWGKLDSAAKANNIELLIVSTYRSYSYQANIIKKKIDSGMLLKDILKENKLPGESEHHTGKAIDLTSLKLKTLSERFEKTEEYKWLINNAHLYNFYLSYPKKNDYVIKFEPWHWYYKKN